MQIPVNTPPDRPTRISIDSGADLSGGGIRMEEFAACDQYTIQGDVFAQAILNDTPVPTSIDDAVANMRVIEAIRRSAASGRAESC